VQEEIAHVWRRSGRDSTTYATFVFGPQGSSPAVPIKRFRGDTLMITFGQGQSPLLYLDGEGLLQVVDARMTTVQTLTRRVADLDMEAIAVQFANMGVVGAASPRDTVTAQVGAASITIDYGRPSARGRQVFGGMVELEKVWRTGANLATHFTTSRDLMIGSQHVPAGSYTLWTIPGAAGDTLVLNSQTGQWGTQHDPARDFARIPLQTERLPQHVEQFTIGIEAGAGGGASGMLTLTWEARRMRVPIIAH
jgi:hypothetical protein